ncbi:MAG: FecR domain-containing protein [Planctomycetes bacterium]|nr:FecR domain-containing protein [Planctomycetota bacterium]
MRCDEVQEHLVAYLAAELPEVQEVEILRHLGKCDTCEGHRKSIEQTLEYTRPFGDFEPSAGGWEDLKERIRTQGEAPAHVGPHRARVYGSIFLAATAACLVLATLVIVLSGEEGSASSAPGFEVAVVSGELRFEDGETCRAPGRRLVQNGARIVNPTAQVSEVRIAGAGTVFLDAGTAFVLEDPREIRIETGKVLLDAEPTPEGGRPLVLSTAHARVLVTGTSLDMETDADRTVLTVLEGRVRFQSDRGEEVVVQEGERSLAGSGHAPSRPTEVHELWRSRAWTTLMADLVTDSSPLGAGEPARVLLTLTNRSSNALAIFTRGKGPFYTLSVDRHGQVVPGYLKPSQVDDESPRPITRDGELVLQPGESYRLRYPVDGLDGPGRYRIVVAYNNGLDGNVGEISLWRGYVEAAAEVWVVDGAGQTQVLLGPFPASGDEAPFVLVVADLALADARRLSDAAGRLEGWEQELAQKLSAAPRERVQEEAAGILNGLLGGSAQGPGAGPIAPASVRVEPVER